LILGKNNLKFLRKISKLRLNRLNLLVGSLKLKSYGYNNNKFFNKFGIGAIIVNYFLKNGINSSYFNNFIKNIKFIYQSMNSWEYINVITTNLENGDYFYVGEYLSKYGQKNSISNLSLENSEFQIKRSLYSLQKFKNILSILGFPNVLDFRHFWSKSLFQITSIPLGFYFFYLTILQCLLLRLLSLPLI
jgi:hypothetical protein